MAISKWRGRCGFNSGHGSKTRSAKQPQCRVPAQKKAADGRPTSSRHLKTVRQNRCARIRRAISADGLNDLIGSYAERGIPIVDLINVVSSKAIAARAAADFYDMGFAAGQGRAGRRILAARTLAANYGPISEATAEYG